MRASTDLSDLIKDKRVWIPALVVGLGLIGGGVWYVTSGQEGGTDAATLPAPGTLPVAPGSNRPGALPVASKQPGGVSASGAPIAVGGPGVVPGGRPSTKGTVAALNTVVKPLVIPNSFAGAPLGYGGGPVAVGGGGGIPAGIPAGIDGGGGLPTTSVASAGTKPVPIKSNIPADFARVDPFIPFYKLIVEQTPAYSLTVPLRLAARPTPTPVPVSIDPNVRFGPLPPVDRRVAGVLFDGSVSAILETGAPGSASTDVRVIQPGATVPSGFANPDTLTVASISPSGVVLRAQDGRTTTVKLSNVSAEFSDTFHNAANGPGIGSGGGSGPQGGPPRSGSGGRGPAGIGAVN